MDKQIPIYFDNAIIVSPAQAISSTNTNLARLKVGAFTKFGNRNGSYITPEVANQLIESAIKGDTPVVGFFDPESQKWAGHTGPILANSYGYVEDFLGWEPLLDTDGKTREYAIFSVVLFTNYFDEAKKIQGQNQSMELDRESITGDWADIDGIEYYVYKTAKMLGFCVIGDHEPCFSVSSFFSKDDNTYKSQIDKFSSFLSALKAQVEEAEKGGEQPMNDLEDQVVVDESPEQFEAPTVEEEPTVEPAAEPEVVEPAVEPEATFEDDATDVEPEEQVTEPEPAVDYRAQFEDLQNTYNQLQETYNQLQNDFTAAQENINSLNEEINGLRAQITNYEQIAAAAENDRKNDLIDSYQSLLDAEEIAPLRDNINDFSYDELESKLAVVFARKQMAANSETHKVPLPEQEESSFALFMKKYKKN